MKTLGFLVNSISKARQLPNKSLIGKHPGNHFEEDKMEQVKTLSQSFGNGKRKEGYRRGSRASTPVCLLIKHDCRPTVLIMAAILCECPQHTLKILGVSVSPPSKFGYFQLSKPSFFSAFKDMCILYLHCPTICQSLPNSALFINLFFSSFFLLDYCKAGILKS